MIVNEGTGRRQGPRRPTPTRRRPSSWIVSAATFVAALALATPSPYAQTPAKQPVMVGALQSLTGGAAAVGLNGITGARLAIKEINGDGGIMGRPVELVIGDDQSDPSAAVSETKRLVFTAKVGFISGPASSQLALAIAPILTEGKVASINVAGSSALTPEASPYGFSAFADSTAQSTAMIDYAVNVAKAGKVALLSDSGANQKLQADIEKRILAERNVTITGIQEYEPRAVDVTPQLLSLRRGTPDLIFLNGSSGEDFGLVFKTLDDIGWSDVKITANTGLGFNFKVAYRVAPNHSYQNVVAQNLKALTYCSGDPIGQSGYSRFLGRLKEFEPEKFERLGYTVTADAYDSVFIFKAAAEATGSTDGAAIAAWIEKSASSLKTVTGLSNPSPGSRFLLGANSLTQVEDLTSARLDGLQHRAGC